MTTGGYRTVLTNDEGETDHLNVRFNNIDGSVFYDKDNTSYYTNPSSNGTSARLAGRVYSGTGSSGAYPGWIDYSNTSGHFVRMGSDNAFFGMKNREGSSGSGNAYNTVIYFGDDTSDDLEFETEDNGTIMRLNGSGGLNLKGYNINNVDKLDANTVDPIYTIGDQQYATYMAGMTGVKEETTGSVQLTKNNKDYTHTIDFQNLEKGSDLWVFYQTSDFGEDWSNLSVLLTGDADVKDTAYYKFLPKEEKLVFYGDDSGRVSYRLTAPRFDHEEWGNDYEGESEGLTVPAMK